MGKNNDPLVSIIVPIFNEEENIKKNVESLLAQIYSNIEIIFIDDASTDAGLKILNRYDDERINIYLNKENMGTSASRNIGLENAKGKYIMFIDGDDWAEDNLVSILVKLAEKDNLDLVQINHIKEESNKSIPQKHFKVKEDIYEGKDDILENVSAIISNNKGNEYYSLIRSVCGKIYKKSIIDKKGIRFKEDLTISEDMVFNLEYLLNAKKLRYEQRYLIHFKKDKDGILESYIKDIEKESKATIKYVRDLTSTYKKEFNLNRKEKEEINKDFAYFIFERIYLLYKHKINREEENLKTKQKRKQIYNYVLENNYIRYLKKIDKKKLNEKEKEFYKFLKTSILLGKLRLI